MTHIHAARLLVAAAMWAGGAIAWSVANIDVDGTVQVAAGVAGLVLIIRLWLQARNEDKRLETERERYDKLLDELDELRTENIALRTENRMLREHQPPASPWGA